MPLALTCTYDPESGEGRKIALSPQFRLETALLRADVLRDLLCQLTRLYDAAVDETFHERTTPSLSTSGGAK